MATTKRRYSKDEFARRGDAIRRLTATCHSLSGRLDSARVGDPPKITLGKLTGLAGFVTETTHRLDIGPQRDVQTVGRRKV